MTWRWPGYAGEQGSRTVTAMSMAWLRQRPARVPTWVIDAGWAVAVAVAVTIAIRAAREPGTRRPDLLAYALGLTLGALLLARRRWPVAVLVASFAALQVYYVRNYPGISAAVPLGVALYGGRWPARPQSRPPGSRGRAGPWDAGAGGPPQPPRLRAGPAAHRDRLGAGGGWGHRQAKVQL
jgi:hypothetical protein